MKLQKQDVLITKTELKTNTKGQAYLWIEFIDLKDGSTFSISEKNVELMNKLGNMVKRKVNLDLTSNKYGLKLSITDVLEDLGSI